MTRAVDTDLRRVFYVPIMIGLLSLSGLVTALLSTGLGRYFAWIAVGSPLIVTLWFGVRQFRGTARRVPVSCASNAPVRRLKKIVTIAEARKLSRAAGENEDRS